MHSKTLLNLIKTRRSVRKYKSKPVPKKYIEQVIEAARWAPSAVNKQPWKFVIVTNKEKRKAIGDYAKFYYLINKHVAQAPVIIVICANTQSNKWSKIDCGLASQNLLLQAHALGLGACFVGAVNEKKIKEALNIPEELNVIGLITLGYPKDKTKAPDRKPLEEIAFYNEYSHKRSSMLKSGITSLIKKQIKRS